MTSNINSTPFIKGSGSRSTDNEQTTIPKPINHNTRGNTIKTILIKKNITAKSIADKIGLSESYFSLMLNGERLISEANLTLILRELSIERIAFGELVRKDYDLKKILDENVTSLKNRITEHKIKKYKENYINDLVLVSAKLIDTEKYSSPLVFKSHNLKICDLFRKVDKLKGHFDTIDFENLKINLMDGNSNEPICNIQELIENDTYKANNLKNKKEKDYIIEGEFEVNDLITKIFHFQK